MFAAVNVRGMLRAHCCVTDTSLRERMEGCLHMPPTYDTVVCRAQLALVSSFLLLLLCPLEWQKSIVMSAFVCVSVSLSVCTAGYLRNHMCDLYQIFCARCLCPWLGPPLAC